MISNYKVKVNDSCNYKVSITDIQNKYKFKLFCAGADLTDYYTKEQVDQSQNTQDILIDNLLNQIPTGTATGETINITDSSSLPIKDIQEAGNTYQETTTGKNLFDKDNANVLNAYFNASQTTIVNNDSNRMIYIPCEPNTTYTMSKIRSAQFNIGYTKQLPTSNVQVYDINTSPTFYDNNKYYYFTITTGVDAEYIVSRIYQTAQDTTITLNEVLASIQVEKSSTVTSYEKYTGGNPAPNPDYPQAITNVTGTNTIKINGKNIFNSTDFESQLVAGKIKNDNGVEVSDSTSQYSQYFIPVKANQPYYFHGYLQRVYLYDANKNWVGRVVGSSATTIMNTSYTPTIDGYIQLQIHTTTYNANKGEEQIELGSSFTTYEAYKEQSYTINLGSIELCKIGNYQDRIYCNNGKWYLEKNIEKFILNGSEASPTLSTNLTNTIRLYYNYDLLPYNALNKLSLSNRLIYNVNWNKDEEGFYFNNNSKNLTMRVNKSTIGTTINEINTYLASNNIIIYYVLATPTTTEITDTTLVSQLDALINSTTYKTTTNITIDTTNQKPTLTLIYRKDLETIIGG